ncbi:MAG: hypothetical protein ACRDBP_18375 [Luteolibacter sp.]
MILPPTANDRGDLNDSISNHRGIRTGAVGVPIEPDSSITPNRDSLEYASNPINQYTAVPQAPATPTFAFDGNMLNGPLQSGAGILPVALVWDAENRLIKAVVPGVTVNFAYDHLSRLISRSAGVSTAVSNIGAKNLLLRSLAGCEVEADGASVYWIKIPMLILRDANDRSLCASSVGPDGC